MPFEESRKSEILWTCENYDVLLLYELKGTEEKNGINNKWESAHTVKHRERETYKAKEEMKVFFIQMIWQIICKLFFIFLYSNADSFTFIVMGLNFSPKNLSKNIEEKTLMCIDRYSNNDKKILA